MARAHERFAGRAPPARRRRAPASAGRAAEPRRHRRAQVRDDEPPPLPQPPPRDRDVAAQGAQLLRRRAQLAARAEWYASHFSADAPVRGESSPHYTNRPRFEGVAERMRELLGASPARSTWCATRSTGCSPTTSTTSAAATRARRSPRPSPIRDSAYVARSRYAFQLEPYLEAFGAERIEIVSREELKRDRAGDDAAPVRVPCVERTSPPISSTASGRPGRRRAGPLPAHGPGRPAARACAPSTATSTGCPSACAGRSSGSSTTPSRRIGEAGAPRRARSGWRAARRRHGRGFERIAGRGAGLGDDARRRCASLALRRRRTDTAVHR